MKSEAMKLLTDLVFGKTVPSESWQEYQRSMDQQAQYHHINYGHAKGTKDEDQV